MILHLHVLKLFSFFHNIATYTRWVRKIYRAVFLFESMYISKFLKIIIYIYFYTLNFHIAISVKTKKRRKSHQADIMKHFLTTPDYCNETSSINRIK